jgi:hypothetical protein
MLLYLMQAFALVHFLAAALLADRAAYGCQGSSETQPDTWTKT